MDSLSIIFCVVWYLIGFIGCGFIKYKLESQLTINDLFHLFIVSLGGLFSVCYGLLALYCVWNTKNKKAFFNKRVF